MNTRPIRFAPDLLDYALIDLTTGEGMEFAPTIVALIDNESYGGCSLVVLDKDNKPKFHEGQVVRVQVGNLNPMLSKIAWARPVEDQILRIGVQYLK